MKKMILIGMMILLSAMGFTGTVSAGGISAGTSEIGLQVGGLIGDDLTDTTVSGKTPELDDDLDARYRYVDELADPNEENLNTGEFTAGIGYAF